MAQAIDRFLEFTLTQGAADGFIEASVSTGILPADGMGWKITEVETYLDPSLTVVYSADAHIEWTLTRDTKAAMPEFSDNDVIMIDGFAVSLTTSGQIVIPAMRRWVPPDGTIIVEPTIYAQLDSNATAQTNIVYMRVHYVEVKLSEVEILRLINNV